MVHDELKDDECPKAIRDLIRENPDIIINDYVTRGCNGEVYFGKRIKLGDEVVLKFYIADKEYDASEEAVILRHINHPNILKIFDLRFIEPWYAYFLSPKISGGDLQQLIDDDKPISSKTALEFTSGILIGLNELHSSHKLVHRDLKPGNILFDKDSNTPIIADLGSVKKINEAEGFTSVSKATRVYLPYESIIDNRFYYQSDLYQVGIVMYQLLGGFFPIHKPDAWLNQRESNRIGKIGNRIQRDNQRDQILDEKICKGNIANTNKLPFYLDKSYKRILNQAIHPDYSKRFQNASEFLKQIHQLQRKNPNYIQYEDYLLITHTTGKEYKIFRNKKGELLIEKKVPGKKWRKDNSHIGNIESALNIARIP